MGFIRAWALTLRAAFGITIAFSLRVQSMTANQLIKKDLTIKLLYFKFGSSHNCIDCKRGQVWIIFQPII